MLSQKHNILTPIGAKNLSINLSHCKLPIDVLKHLLLGPACNKLNISSNHTGGAGAGVLENALPVTSDVRTF